MDLLSRTFNFPGCGVAFASLRLLKPVCSLDKTWSEEPIDQAVPRLVDALLVGLMFFRSLPSCQRVLLKVATGIRYVDRETDEGAEVDFKKHTGSCLPAASLSFCFPFLRCILTQKKQKDKKIAEKAVLFLESHLCQYVGDDNGVCLSFINNFFLTSKS